MTETLVTETTVLDARNLACPMPIVKTAKAVKGLEPGQVLKLITTDRGSIADVPAWAEATGNELVEWYEQGAELVFLIRKRKEV
jgi:tRNA 2-thiouridine synthesizing protein A